MKKLYHPLAILIIILLRDIDNSSQDRIMIERVMFIINGSYIKQQRNSHKWHEMREVTEEKKAECSMDVSFIPATNSCRKSSDSCTQRSYSKLST